MKPEDIHKIVGDALRDPANFPWIPFIFTILLCAIACFIGTYLVEKAKNNAIREDIARITNEVEGIKHLYSERLASIKETIDLRSAALSERLKAHQEAYALWVKLMQNVHERDAVSVVSREAQVWWSEHCLYLSPEARDAFRSAIFAAAFHGSLLQDRSNKDLIEKNWKKLEDAGSCIVKAVQLPDIGEAQFTKELSNK